MSFIDRKTEIYNIYIRNFQKNTVYKKSTILNEVLEKFFFKYLISDYEKENNKIFTKGKDKTYWINYLKKNEVLYNIKLSYLVHNKEVNIRNVTTLRKTGTKNRDEGDEERQHFVIRLSDKPIKNAGIIVFEKVQQGILITDIERELNTFFKGEFKEINDGERGNKLKLENLEIAITAVPHQEFLEEINDFEKISLLTITIDAEKSTIDDEVKFSGDNLTRKEVELVYKPTLRSSLDIKGIKNYYKKYSDNKNGKISRIRIEGKGKQGKIKLDTESARLSKYLKILEDKDGLIDTKDIFTKYQELVNNEFNDYLKNTIKELYEKGEEDEGENF